MTAIHYVMDPMCSWCWAFRPEWDKISAQVPQDASVRYVMGGLAPDSDAPMPDQMREYLQQVWRTIAERTGAQFNDDFWKKCEPRRSTYPACRAVIAARAQGAEHSRTMIDMIQRAYYLNARNPSDKQTLVELAEEIGLERDQFEAELGSAEVERTLRQEVAWARSVGADGFPSVLLEKDGRMLWLVRGYSKAEPIIERLASALV
ncbi:MAG: DsbA family protein [Gammaproteobacteria bacterium]|nr:DsbA family protein [Gammaproteobacteria bacterium]